MSSIYSLSALAEKPPGSHRYHQAFVIHACYIFPSARMPGALLMQFGYKYMYNTLSKSANVVTAYLSAEVPNQMC